MAEGASVEASALNEWKDTTMTNFKKATFKSIGTETMKEREGYTFEYLLADNTVVTLAVYKNPDMKHNAWCVIDPEVGQALCYGKTRADAVRKADEWREKFTNLRNSAKWNDLVKLFESYEANGGVNPKLRKKPHDKKALAKAVEMKAKAMGADAKATVYEDDIATTVVIEPKRPAKPEVKPEPPKTEVKVTRAAIIPTPEGIKAEVVDEHVETVEHPVEGAAVVVTLETMREWVKGKPLEVHVAGKTPEKQAKNPIWICGPSKPWKAELMAMGFAWGKHNDFGKGWWANPTA